MEPSIMLAIVPSAPALNRLAAILMTFIWYIRDVRAQPWQQTTKKTIITHFQFVRLKRASSALSS